MKIAALVKQVPDTATQIQIKPDHSAIVSLGVKYILGPYDEFALEEALRTKERIPGSEVVVLTVGPERSVDMLRSAMAMGADHAVRIWDPSLESIDPHGTALLLAKKLEGLGCDLLWCGRQAVDDDMGIVGGIVAERLGLPFVSLVNQFELSEDRKTARVGRQIEGGDETLLVILPCVLSAQKGLNEPRYPSLAGMMKAKKKEIEQVNALELLPDVERLMKIRVLSIEPPPARPPGKIIDGTPEEAVKKLIVLLREEAKVI